MFSSTAHPETKSYADAKLNITIPWHCLSVYGSSTPGEFWGNLTEADTVSGFLARLLIFESNDAAELPRMKVNSVVPKKVIDQINALWAITPPIDKERGDIARVPVPFIVPRSPDAEKIFSEWSTGYFNRRNQNRDDEAISAIYGRAAEHAAKLAIIHAASRQGLKVASGKVEVVDIQWAMTTIDACINRLIHGIHVNIAKNKFHADQQRVLKLIREKTGHSMTIRELYRALHMPNKQAVELVQSLIASGEIKQYEYERNKKHVIAVKLKR